MCAPIVKASRNPSAAAEESIGDSQRILADIYICVGRNSAGSGLHGKEFYGYGYGYGYGAFSEVDRDQGLLIAYATADKYLAQPIIELSVYCHNGAPITSCIKKNKSSKECKITNDYQ